MTRTINNIARKNGKLKEGSANIPGEFIREGLTAVISVKVPEPEFEGQTKTRLGEHHIMCLTVVVLYCSMLTMICVLISILLGIEMCRQS